MPVFSECTPFWKMLVRKYLKMSSLFFLLFSAIAVVELISAGIITVYISSTFYSVRIGRLDYMHKKSIFQGIATERRNIKQRDYFLGVINQSASALTDFKTVPSTIEIPGQGKYQAEQQAKMGTERKDLEKNVWKVQNRWENDEARLNRIKHGLATTELTAWDDWRCSDCFENYFQFSYSSLNICASDDGKSDTIDLLVVVTSQVKNIENRMALRRTWLSLAKNNTSNIRYIFLLWNIDDIRSIEDIGMENIVHKDIVIGYFTDNYEKLTIKTMAGILWTTRYCPNSKYMMKTDDDMWMNH